MNFLKERKYFVWPLAVIFLLSQILVTPVFAQSAASESKIMTSLATVPDRIAGTDRYKTAVAISQKGWGSSDYAVLVRGDDFADALCAGPLAQKYGGPILLTSSNQLNVDTLNELKRLEVKHLFIVGGLGAVYQNVENALQASGIPTIERIYGNDRYETSVKIAQKIGNTGKVVLATGIDFPDALSISGIAAKLGMPILLTAKNSLPASVSSYFQTNTVTQTYVVGGTSVISDTVANSVTNPSRLAGNDRYTTNVAIMQNFASELNFDTIYIATGTNFADALAGAVLAAKSSSPLVLTDVNMPSGTASFLKTNLKLTSNVVGLGGSNVVPSNVLTSFEKSSDVEYGNTPGNINNNGLACLKGDWIYCQENLNNFSSGLYRVKTDGSGQQKLSADNVNDINVVGDWVYYSCISDAIDNTDYGEKLYRIKTDGPGRQKLNDDRSRNVIVAGDWVYYINLNDFSYNLYRIKTDGSGRQKLSDNSCLEISVAGDWIYFYKRLNPVIGGVSAGFAKLYRMKTDGSEEELLQ
jgi:putative cell wall-binding protein